ncbi:MAG TPA: TetR/AcrR family transcriptional regulator [Solirubrobacterales bacterium]|nr:TetR/AcrR family transcriptional regulator [Solirubrobacterales bacterium]
MVEICAEKTFSATTIADIVGRANISRTTFYKHFADKRACFDAALEDCIDRLREVAVAARAPTDTPPQAVRKATAAILELLAARPDLAQVALGEAVSVDPAVVARYREMVIPALEGCWTAAGEEMRGSSDPRIAFGRVQILLFEQISAGKAKRLPALLPEIVYIAVLPFAGHEEALRQARLTSEGQADPATARGR